MRDQGPLEAVNGSSWSAGVCLLERSGTLKTRSCYSGDPPAACLDMFTRAQSRGLCRYIVGTRRHAIRVAYNAETSHVVCGSMTTKIKNYPFEVVISAEIPSAVQADQVKSLARRK